MSKFLILNNNRVYQPKFSSIFFELLVLFFYDFFFYDTFLEQKIFLLMMKVSSSYYKLTRKINFITMIFFENEKTKNRIFMKKMNFLNLNLKRKKKDFWFCDQISRATSLLFLIILYLFEDQVTNLIDLNFFALTFQRLFKISK
jgi:hypothetical protein